jgi:hypothetical protein
MAEYVYNNTQVSKDTLQQLYRGKVQASLQRFARSVTHSNTSVRIEVTGEYATPAFSNDKDIVLNHYETSGSILAADNLIRLKGLVVHELSHLLFTPRSRTVLAQWVRNKNFWNAFNILEDNRIENMMVAKMSGIAPWLVHTITVELLKDDYAMKDALPLVWGRKYLPLSVRKAALAAWPYPDGDVVARLVDKYIKLNLADTKQVEQAKAIIAEFYGLISNATAPSTHNGSEQTTPDSDIAVTQTKGQQDKLLNQLDDIENDDTDADGDVDSSTQDNSSTAQEQLRAAVTRANEEASEEVYEDVKSTIQSVRDVDSPVDVKDSWSLDHRRKVGTINKTSITRETPLPDATVASRKFARELQEFRAAHDPGWLRKTESGRLNVRDYMLGADIETVFDQWSDGNQDVTDIECVILLDVSGSMTDMLTPAYNAMWSVKRALDSINAATTVIQFGSYGEVLYPADTKAGPIMLTARNSSGGGTSPFYSIERARDILNQSSRAIKMFIIITDGQWDSSRQCDELILSMRMTGTLTGLVFLMPPLVEGQTVWWLPRDDNKYVIDGHNCEVAQALDTPLDIVHVAKAMTALAQRKVLN